MLGPAGEGGKETEKRNSGGTGNANGCQGPIVVSKLEADPAEEGRWCAGYKRDSEQQKKEAHIHREEKKGPTVKMRKKGRGEKGRNDIKRRGKGRWDSNGTRCFSSAQTHLKTTRRKAGPRSLYRKKQLKQRKRRTLRKNFLRCGLQVRGAPPTHKEGESKMTGRRKKSSSSTNNRHQLFAWGKRPAGT